MTGAVLLGSGLACSFVSLFVLARLLLPLRGRHIAIDAPHGWRTLQAALAQTFEERLVEAGRQHSLTEWLASAGLDLRPGEWISRTALRAIVGAVVGGLLGGMAGALAFGALVVLGSRLYVSWSIDRRKARFEEQLVETLQVLGGAMRSGQSLPQALHTVVSQSQEPSAGEFQRALNEHRLGSDLAVTLGEVAKRMDSVDLAHVVSAIEIHRDVGGDLSRILDRVAAHVRNRQQLRRQARALSAEGRISGVILTILPPAMVAVLSVVSPGYLGQLTGTAAGRLMALTAVGLLVVGGLWLRRLGQVEV